MIGIRLANNTFFPVLDEDKQGRADGRAARKRLILTTVKNDQETVQIDLYRGESKEIDKDTYLASLTVENIRTAKAGDPDIELVMATDNGGQLQARAYDRAGGAENSLSVSLQELSPNETYETPDFSIGDDFATHDSLGEYRWDAESEPEADISEPADDEPVRKQSTRAEAAEAGDGEERHRSPVVAIVLLAAGVVAIAVLAYFLLRTKPAASAPQLSNQTVSTPKPASTAPAAPAQAPVAPAASATAPTSESSTQTPSPENMDGIWYRIAFGDTLWDLAYSFYNNPRQFGLIAKKNSIANPNKIYGGNRIFIPLDQAKQKAAGQ
ncbi:MAG TPA: Hsp70 family protein [Spirochaetia bacterium]|nr:Hsp70 family protein [Spirochaetia bacterium]